MTSSMRRRSRRSSNGIPDAESITEKVDPVKVNLTLSAAAQALTGLGRQVRAVDRQRQQDPRRPEPPNADDPPRHSSSSRRLGDVYANAAPDLFDALDNAVTTARTLNRPSGRTRRGAAGGDRLRQHRQRHLHAQQAVLERLAADLVPTAHLLDTYSPQVFCTIRNFADVAPQRVAAARERQPLLRRQLGGTAIARHVGEPLLCIRTTCRGSTPAADPAASRLLAADHP